MSNMHSQRILRGGIAGLVATGSMTLMIAAGRAWGMLQLPPPEEIVANAVKAVGFEHPYQHPGFQVVWLTAHLGFGTSWGLVYPYVRPILPGSTALAGLIAGEFIWTVNYAGAMPALNLYPSPAADNKARMGLMIVAHAVYGFSLSITARYLILPNDVKPA